MDNYDDRVLGLVGNTGGFSSEDEVDEYFTVEQLSQLFPGEELPSQDDLDELAIWLVTHRWTEAASFWVDPDAEDLAELLLNVFDAGCKLDQTEVVEHLVDKKWASREVLDSLDAEDWLEAWGIYRKRA